MSDLRRALPVAARVAVVSMALTLGLRMAGVEGQGIVVATVCAVAVLLPAIVQRLRRR